MSKPVAEDAIAVVNFSRSSSFEEYTGKSILLKHVLLGADEMGLVEQILFSENVSQEERDLPNGTKNTLTVTLGRANAPS